ncbi:hypothetical protein E2C01_051956 [Portunus trituberculatus]|uniref:Uncharacterized protein n=1 Tax=Portunus trituberculatus TaxID=210409 RepID=A0A5B7GN42_PORTR|nr:hypothetical protein [Portunus trituberculatus]
MQVREGRQDQRGGVRCEIVEGEWERGLVVGSHLGQDKRNGMRLGGIGQICSLIVYLRVVVAKSPSLVPSVTRAPKRPSASLASGDTPKRARKIYTLERTLTAANLSECMDLRSQ